MASATLIIPARWGSSRFEGKPLTATLTGQDGIAKPLIWWTYQAALQALPSDKIWVATDDDRIANAAQEFGAQTVMTAIACRNGTERIQEAASKLELSNEEIIINLQGDAPLTPPHFVTALINAMDRDPHMVVATPALRCDTHALSRFIDQRQQGLVGGTTLVKSASGKALYFSKEVLPFSDKIDVNTNHLPVFHHVGLYAYRRPALETYVSMSPGLLEDIEGLEQLRFLENDIPVQCVEVDAEGHMFWEVNNPEDIELVSKDLGN